VAVSTETSRSRSDEILDVAEARSAWHRSNYAIWDAVADGPSTPSGGSRCRLEGDVVEQLREGKLQGFLCVVDSTR